MLEANGLSCVRGRYQVFVDVSFSLPAGALLRVRGSNGSGKTSLLRVLAGLGHAETGTLSWRGKPVAELAEEYHRDLVYLGHAPAVKDELTAYENLTLGARLAGDVTDRRTALAALADVGLGGRAHLPVKVLSQGQKRRIGLARLALTKKPLWVMDEPFTALDVAATARLRGMIEAHLARGGLAVLTTHHEIGLASSESSELDLDR